MIQILTGALDVLFTASELPQVLDDGEEGVYFWLASAVQDVAATAIPAYAAALETCNAAAGVATGEASTCSDAATDLLAVVIDEVCHAIGLNYVIEGIVAAWKAIPDWVKDGIGYAVDVLSYLAEIDLSSVGAFASRIASAIASFDWLDDVGEWLQKEVLGAIGSKLGSLARGLASEVGEAVDKLVDQIDRYVKSGKRYIAEARRYLYQGAAALYALTGDAGAAVVSAVVWLGEAAATAVEGVGDAIVEGAEAVGEAISDTADAVAEGAVDIAEGFVETIGFDVDW